MKLGWKLCSPANAGNRDIGPAFDTEETFSRLSRPRQRTKGGWMYDFPCLCDTMVSGCGSQSAGSASIRLTFLKLLSSGGLIDMTEKAGGQASRQKGRHEGKLGRQANPHTDTSSPTIL